ncbi:DUF4169 domain-containing protein [Rhodobacter xanthinilyticus]|uniref:DUF4169 domain-containing protein n=1 Tax=Rhodobacter xanthinilyticus TaxID=1850250 RepID=A0A1D9MC09_9RHOB|nr:DUF4169 family protein [Rhodobacter xanthinilyticus]AOZ69338.1 DUF4169 domain-containing protein [Rhodobacter xanthinilyticus]
MSNVTNLTQFRKQKARAEKRTEADANAAKFGRTKAQRLREEAEAARAAATLEGHKRDSDAPEAE